MSKASVKGEYSESHSFSIDVKCIFKYPIKDKSLLIIFSNVIYLNVGLFMRLNE